MTVTHDFHEKKKKKNYSTNDNLTRIYSLANYHQKIFIQCNKPSLYRQGVCDMKILTRFSWIIS